MPLMREGVPIGVLGLMRSEPRPFTDRQIELVTTFAAQGVIAIENARLLNELRQRTSDLTESLEQPDGDIRSPAGHQFVARRAGACVPGHVAKCSAYLRGQV